MQGKKHSGNRKYCIKIKSLKNRLDVKGTQIKNNIANIFNKTIKIPYFKKKVLTEVQEA